MSLRAAQRELCHTWIASVHEFMRTGLPLLSHRFHMFLGVAADCHPAPYQLCPRKLQHPHLFSRLLGQLCSPPTVYIKPLMVPVWRTFWISTRENGPENWKCFWLFCIMTNHQCLFSKIFSSSFSKRISAVLVKICGFGKECVMADFFKLMIN